MASSIFWRSVLPYLWTIKDEFLATTGRKFFDENILKQFYKNLCVQVFNQLFCLLFKLLLNYILINTLKNYLPRTLTYIHMKLPMMAVFNIQTATDGGSSQSKSKYTMVVLL